MYNVIIYVSLDRRFSEWLKFSKEEESILTMYFLLKHSHFNIRVNVIEVGKQLLVHV